MYRKLEHPQYAQISENDTRFFLQFHTVTSIEAKLLRQIGWAHPELLAILKHKSLELFIDGTFRCTPKPFYQCYILMAFDPETDEFLPIYFTLLESKSEWTYWMMLNNIICSTHLKIDAESITLDFEEAAIKAAKGIHIPTYPINFIDQFTKARVIGCFFHWKQANERFMSGLGLDSRLIFEMCKPGGHLDLLASIPGDEISEFGIPYIRTQLGFHESDEAWNKYWEYFEATWLQKFGPELWNTYQHIEAGLELHGRTNNALESFNSRLNSAFPCAHPSLLQFIETIRRISCETAKTRRDILVGNQRRKNRDVFKLMNIPKSYSYFKKTTK